MKTQREINILANKFLKMINFDVSVSTLEKFVEESSNVKLYFFNNTTLPGDIIISTLDKLEYAKHHTAFSIIHDKSNFIFIKSGLSEVKTKLLILHEIHHVFFETSTTKWEETASEQDANAFANAVLRVFQDCCHPQNLRFKRNLKLIIVALLCITFISFVAKLYVSNYITKYYITTTGHKYHTIGCYTIKNTISKPVAYRLIKNDYTPCKICIE